MKRDRSNFIIGLTIGILATLLAAALAILFVPRLRPLVGLNGTDTNATNTTVQNNTSNVTENTTRPPVETESENISVTSPEPYAEVRNPFTVKGAARVFENVVSVRLLDGDGTVLAETFATSEAPDIGMFGPFELNLTYQQNKYLYGTLEVYQSSAKDGSEIDKVRIPVSFEEGAGV